MSTSVPPRASRRRTNSFGHSEYSEYAALTNHDPFPPPVPRSSSHPRPYPLSSSPISAHSPRIHSSSSLKSLSLSPRYLLRPSIRLKTTLYSLVLVILTLSFLALNAASLTRPKAEVAPTALSTSPAGGSPADSGEGVQLAQGKDAHLVNETIARSFEEPDFALLSGLQPHEIGCDIPLQGEAAGEGEGTLVFLGIFSGSLKGRKRRDLYRKTIIPDFPPHLVTIKFILGLPPFTENVTTPEGTTKIVKVNREKIQDDIKLENEQHGDMVVLPVIDNIDLGKTHEYFKWVANEYAGEGRVKGRPRFVMKADDDTILVMPNVMSSFRHLDCRKNIYWGTSAGKSHWFGDYFRGLAYAMSWPLVSWIGSAAMPTAHTIKIEDARTGQWLRHLDPVIDPVRRIDMGWTMGDFNQLEVGIETVALHWIKMDDWVTEQHDRLLQIWKDADRPYTPENGVPPKQSIAKGKIVPAAAQIEHERQKGLGWDVKGNLDP